MFQHRSPYRTFSTTEQQSPQRERKHAHHKQQQQQPRFRVRSHFVDSDGYRSRITDNGTTTGRRNKHGYYEVEFDDGVTQFLPAEWIQVVAKFPPATKEQAQTQANTRIQYGQHGYNQIASPIPLPSSDDEELTWIESEDEQEADDKEHIAPVSPPASASLSSKPSRKTRTTYSTPQSEKRQVLVDGVAIEEVEGPVNRVPLERRLPDDYPYVLEQIGEQIELLR